MRTLRLACGISALLVAAMAAAQPLSAGMGAGMVVERGPNHARLSPIASAACSYSIAIPSGEITIRADASLGALIGKVAAVRLGASYGPDLAGPWRPSVGLGLQVDGGDAFFMASGPAAGLPPAMGYVSANLRPLSFRSGPWTASWLEIDAAMGFESLGSTWRFGIGLMSLERSLP